MIKTINNVLAIAIGIIGICSTAEVSQAECPPRKEGSIEIPIVFEFENPEFRTEWIYQSLNPNLQLANEPHSSYNLIPKFSNINNGKLELIYCVDADEFQEINGEFKASFASRTFTFIPRPIQWNTVTMDRYPENLEVEQGKMSTIYFVNQPDPDWIVVRQAQILYTSEDLLRVDLIVHNYTKTVHPGFDVKLFASFGIQLEGDTPSYGYHEIPIEIDVSKEEATLASGDIQSLELIQRDVDVFFDKEGKITYIDVDLGNTGQFSSEELLRIRYVFNSNEKFSKKLRGEIYVEGDEIYPGRIELSR